MEGVDTVVKTVDLTGVIVNFNAFNKLAFNGINLNPIHTDAFDSHLIVSRIGENTDLAVVFVKTSEIIDTSSLCLIGNAFLKDRSHVIAVLSVHGHFGVIVA